MRVSVDIETALYGLLTAGGYNASAHALPSTLGSTFPHVHVVRTGGFTSDLVVETHYVDFDVYAADQADAMKEASNMCELVRNLEGQTIGTCPCYSSEITTLPYGNPDPRHPTIGRATLKAQILTRTRGANNA